MWGDAGAPLRPGLSGATKGPETGPTIPSCPAPLPTSLSHAVPRVSPQPRGTAVPGLGALWEPDLSVPWVHRWGCARGQGPCPHVVVPMPPALCGWAPAARCHRGAAGRAVSQLSAQRGPSRPRDPPCPPLCFADPAACSCRLPRLVARFQPHSAYLSSSLHPTARVYPLRPALSLPAPQPPARQGLSSAEEGRHGTSLASSRHALASLSQAAARAPCVAGKLCPLHPSLLLPLAFHRGWGAHPPAPSTLAPSRCPCRRGSRPPPSQASLPPRPQHRIAPGRVWPTGSCVAVQTAEPVPAAPTGDHGHWGRS